jgi:hypothetical protein
VLEHYVRGGPECYECGAAALHIRDGEQSSRTARTKKRQKVGSDGNGSSGYGKNGKPAGSHRFESHCTSAVG